MPALERPTPVVLTHDIDSPEGLTNLLGRFLPARGGGRRALHELRRAVRVADRSRRPRGARRARPRGRRARVRPQQHDGVRGRRRAARGGSTPRGRSPNATARSATARRRCCGRARCCSDLDTRYRYDSSIPTSGGLFPVPNNGCATARPFVDRGHRRTAADHAARRQPEVSRLLAGGNRRAVDGMRRHHRPRQAASSSC